MVEATEELQSAIRSETHFISGPIERLAPSTPLTRVDDELFGGELFTLEIAKRQPDSTNEQFAPFHRVRRAFADR